MDINIEPDVTLDCSGLCCSMPLSKARVELDNMKVGLVLEVIADYPAAEEDMRILSRVTGNALVKSWKDGDHIHFLIKKIR
jgi:tRNA 2-thiouridine synthesizing protein A